jgi:23S rRNA (cytidine1920-2'-O)/16S rRNA (cytidine1409-2'-O)-methyltransferase
MDADVSLLAPDHPFVSRGGLKLERALDAFGINPTGRFAIDVGASTGGFTDVLLRRGAAGVIALDVGHGQLDWRLRNDPRVTVLERVNARWLTPEQLPSEFRPITLASIDVSFISLTQILPAVAKILAHGADTVALVKPQFEAGRDEVGKGGIVRDEAIHQRVIAEVTDAALALGFTRAGLVDSPITGMEGNREFLLHLQWPDA